MADPTPQPRDTSQKTDAGHTFPDPSLTLIEFGEALGVLIAGRTESDAANRRLLLKKVVYVRIEASGWGATTLPEVWIEQTEGLFTAVEPSSGRIFRDPSRRRYEVGFISKDIFDCTIQCLKERNCDALYELTVVTFGKRKGFSLEEGGLVAPDDYAADRSAINLDNLFPLPPQLNPAG